MKSKKNTYLLLVGVLSIWGIVAFKIFSAVSPKDTKIKQKQIIQFNPKHSKVIDTFSISIVNRDPFLGTMYVKPKREVVVKKSNVNRKEIVWKDVSYHGNISKKGNTENICIVSIDGNQRVMHVGQEFGGVKLISATNAHILVSYQGAKKRVAKL
ncbi:hypothetical protein NO995_07460 [Aestuariibaculum sp. M13]|uniref:hypothetical protein n=1 Tax=unclassified Aestuariibaculum TaxID=2646735 RepID=UPI00215A0192|nr:MULTISPECIES: hypothetical protein [unclassified Aestuariibaculum]MCR8667512.1 hypothetical protein [Aestuariibaculum sp. M13]WMI65252.1 hypothetical protein RBH94_14445 [Aestuariibaculum sp. YM273]